MRSFAKLGANEFSLFVVSPGSIEDRDEPGRQMPG